MGICYNHKQAYLLGVASELAYLTNTDDINKQLKLMLGDNTWVPALITHHNSQALILKNQYNDIILSFKGTDSVSLEEWIQNANTSLTKWTSNSTIGQIHTGFCECLIDVYNNVIRSLSKTQVRSLYVTGHSLGGALAVIFSVLYNNITGVYTFGQPRAGDAVFAKTANTVLSEKYFRLVNDHDIIPHVPFPFINSYRHAGKLIFFKHDASVCLDPTIYDLPSVMMSLVSSFKGNPKELVTDHFMLDYLQKIKANM
jgi:hypothetical protein